MERLSTKISYCGLVSGIFLALLQCQITLGGKRYLDDVRPCIPIVTSDKVKNGTITSPNYPSNYPKIRCRYDFVGKPNERVQVVFTDFNLYHPETVYSDKYSDPDRPWVEDHRNEKNRRERERDCGIADVLSAFVYFNDNLARVDDFCGSTTPLAVMSNGPNLTLEFNAPFSSPYVRGFSALYAFVTDFGIRDGKQLDTYPCAFVFNRTNSGNGTGSFTSPNYPGLYPRDTECHYFFYGGEKEHVELHFTYFDIDGLPPCDDNGHADYVEFSNYMPIDRKYDRKCGTGTSFKVKSDRNFFRVTFRSNDRFDATGFSATFQFSDVTTDNNQLTFTNVRSVGCQMFFSILLHVTLMTVLCFVTQF